jgi:hypothetical protein
MTVSDKISLISQRPKYHVSKLDASCRLFKWSKVNLIYRVPTKEKRFKTESLSNTVRQNTETKCKGNTKIADYLNPRE